MANEEIKITVPEGYEIDKENSTFECIKFKKKALSYDDVAKALFKQKAAYYINDRGEIRATDSMVGTIADATNGVTKKQLEQGLAFNKLRNVAEYLNEKTVDWKDADETKWYIYYNHEEGSVEVLSNHIVQSSSVYFCSKEHATRAIEILGETEIKKALGVF